MSNTEFIFKIIDTAIAVISLLLIIVGWIIPYRYSLKINNLRINSEKELERIHWKKDFIDRQISELYGPIYALIIEGDISFSRILDQLGRSCIIPEGKSFYDLPEEEQKIWKHYVDTYKIKNQMKMVEIMRNNLHLIYNSDLPNCYKEFLEYSLGWELLDNQKCQGVPNYYEYYYVFSYPTEFNHYIRSTLKLLLDEQAKLIIQSEEKSNTYL